MIFGARAQQDLVQALLEEVIGPMYDAVAPYDRGGMYFLAQEMKVLRRSDLEETSIQGLLVELLKDYAPTRSE